MSKMTKSKKVGITGEGTSGPPGGKMHPSQALEKGGRVCKGGEYSYDYGKNSRTKGGKKSY